MKKRNQILAVVVFAVLAFAAVWFLWLMPAPKIAADNISKLTVTALPSPPTMKTITDGKQIQAFADAYNSLPLKRSPAFGNAAGWQIKIDTNDYRYGSIVVAGDQISIHGFRYSTDHDSITKFENAVRNLLST